MRLVISRARTTLASVGRQAGSRFEVIFTARLTARLRPNAVIRSQVKHEILFLSNVVDLVAVWTHHLKADIMTG